MNAGQNIGTALGNAGQAKASGANNKSATAGESSISNNENTATTAAASTPTETPPINERKLSRWTNNSHTYFPNSYIGRIKQVGKQKNAASSLGDLSDNSFEAIINRITKINNNLYL